MGTAGERAGEVLVAVVEPAVQGWAVAPVLLVEDLARDRPAGIVDHPELAASSTAVDVQHLVVSQAHEAADQLQILRVLPTIQQRMLAPVLLVPHGRRRLSVECEDAYTSGPQELGPFVHMASPAALQTYHGEPKADARLNHQCRIKRVAVVEKRPDWFEVIE